MAHCVNCGGLIPSVGQYHRHEKYSSWRKCIRTEHPKTSPSDEEDEEEEEEDEETDTHLMVCNRLWSTDEQDIARQLSEILLEEMGVHAQVVENPRTGKKYCLFLDYKKFTFLGEPSGSLREFLLENR